MNSTRESPSLATCVDFRLGVAEGGGARHADRGRAGRHRVHRLAARAHARTRQRRDKKL